VAESVFAFGWQLAGVVFEAVNDFCYFTHDASIAAHARYGIHQIAGVCRKAGLQFSEPLIHLRLEFEPHDLQLLSVRLILRVAQCLEMSNLGFESCGFISYVFIGRFHRIQTLDFAVVQIESFGIVAQLLLKSFMLASARLTSSDSVTVVVITLPIFSAKSDRAIFPPHVLELAS
jgi:hypothetical protein